MSSAYKYILCVYAYYMHPMFVSYTYINVCISYCILYMYPIMYLTHVSYSQLWL